MDWFDLEALIAGLNTLLPERGSDLRYATLNPHCVPCSKVAAGPSQVLIEVTDPFNLLWTERSFDSEKALR